MGWREFWGLDEHQGLEEQRYRGDGGHRGYERYGGPPPAEPARRPVRTAEREHRGAGAGPWSDDDRYEESRSRLGEPRYDDERYEEQRYLEEMYRAHEADEPGQGQPVIREADADEGPGFGGPAERAPAPGGEPGARDDVPEWRHDPPTAEQVMNQAAAGRGSTGGGLAWRFPPQQVIASYGTHGEAARAVEYLADQGFPVERTAIVGRGLTSVEMIGRQSWRDSAAHTIGGMAALGALLGWLFGLLDWASPLRAAFSLALWGLLFGAVLGLLVGLAMRVFAGSRKQKITHSHAYRADSYDLLCDTDIADRARSMLVLGGFPVTAGAVRRAAVTPPTETPAATGGTSWNDRREE